MCNILNQEWLWIKNVNLWNHSKRHTKKCGRTQTCRNATVPLTQMSQCPSPTPPHLGFAGVTIYSAKPPASVLPVHVTRHMWLHRYRYCKTHPPMATPTTALTSRRCEDEVIGTDEVHRITTLQKVCFYKLASVRFVRPFGCCACATCVRTHFGLQDVCSGLWAC